MLPEMGLKSICGMNFDEQMGRSARHKLTEYEPLRHRYLPFHRVRTCCGSRWASSRLVCRALSLETDYAQERPPVKSCALELSYATFKKVIEENGKTLRVVMRRCVCNRLPRAEYVFVQFYSDTCPACKRLEPFFNQLSCDLAKEYPNLKLAKVRLECKSNAWMEWERH